MSKWTIDAAHSFAGFAVKHLMVTNIRGQFTDISGTIRFDPANAANSSVEAEIKTASISTGNQKRDEHLRSPDFFDTEKYSKITFKSIKIEITDEKRGKVSGNLTMHGVTRPVTLNVEYFGPVKSPYGGEITIGFSASARINREEFGITWNEPMEDGGVMVGKDVQIILDIEADLME